MTTESEKKKVSLFIGFLAIMAFAINGYFLSRENSATTPSQLQSTSQTRPQEYEDKGNTLAVNKATEEAEAARKAAEAAAERARYLKRYLSMIPVHQAGIETVAVSVSSDDGSVNSVLTDALMQHFKSDTAKLFPYVFTPEFVSDGLMNQVFTGSSALIDKLELRKSLDSLLLAKQSVQYSTNSSALQNVLTATVRLEIATLPLAKQGRKQTWTLTANGAGFKEADARAMAEERIIKQIMSDTKMSLHPSSTQATK